MSPSISRGVIYPHMGSESGVYPLAQRVPFESNFLQRRLRTTFTPDDHLYLSQWVVISWTTVLPTRQADSSAGR